MEVRCVRAVAIGPIPQSQTGDVGTSQANVNTAKNCIVKLTETLLKVH